MCVCVDQTPLGVVVLPRVELRLFRIHHSLKPLLVCHSFIRLSVCLSFYMICSRILICDRNLNFIVFITADFLEA